MKNSSRIFLVFLVILAVAAGLFYIRAWQKNTPDAAVLKRGTVVEAVYATGEVEPENWAQISPQMTVKIKKIHSYEGDIVSAGEVLAAAEATVEEARRDELSARLEFLTAELKRYEALRKQGHASEQKYQSVISEHKAIAAELTAQNQLLSRMDILSPMEGVVLRRDVEEGEVKTPSDTIYWVGQKTPLRITAEVDEEDIPRVEVGQKVLIKSDAFVGQKIEGKVSEITPKGDPVNKIFRIRVSLPADTQLFIGMTVELNIITQVKENALVLPLSAVVDGYVYPVTGGDPVAVETGLSDEDNIEILSGLREGDEVILMPEVKL